MSSRLEQFIRDNREQFDSEEPSPLIWKKMEQQLAPTKATGRVIAMKLLRWSAAAAVLILAGTGVYSLLKDKPDNTQAATTPASKEKTGHDLLNEINPTYAKEVYHFTQLIELKQSELKQIEKENPSLYKQFLSDINNLDSSYNALKKQLPDNANREQLLEAMIQNLRLQADLLNQQLQVIQQIKQSKRENHEQNSKTT